MADFKVRCVENKKAINHCNFEVNKCYEVKDGEITGNTGYVFRAWSVKDKSFKSLKDWFDVEGIKFELVEDESEDKPKQFTKDMLKTGMRVEITGGWKYIALPELNILVRPNGWLDLNSFADDLSIASDSYYNISKIYAAPIQIRMLDVDCYGKLLWTRPEPIILTIEEAEAALTEVEGREVKIKTE